MTSTTSPFPFASVLRIAFLPSLLAGLVTTGVVGALWGAGALVSGLVGVVVAVAFFGSGLLVCAKVVRDANPLLFLAVGMSVYFGQVILLFAFFVLTKDAHWMHPKGFAFPVLAVALTWQVMQFVAWRRAHIPVYDSPAPDPGASS